MEGLIVGALTLLFLLFLLVWYGLSKLSKPVSDIEEKIEELSKQMDVSTERNRSAVELVIKNQERLITLERKMRDNEILITLIEEKVKKEEE